ncbi:phage terminase small subunit [Halomonas organivorans]|uniref:Tetratricopeptide (TPR) repeat protein n=1 Tax=Halomonas organivorans TaxID=257772 RepID=A0A7W5G5J9_9GAMM|nr:phage terminase small subunit [Halomonas organivorans]MBB3141199.1 tetratricopeptide (TPR) repeat protein [Halomonas organivorans]
MQSPARNHYARVSAAQAAGAADPESQQNGEQYEIHAAALYEARRTLKGIKSTEQKIAKKREILPEFDAYVAGVLEAGTGAQDDVLMTVMIWRLDVGDLDGALAIAEYALRHGLDAPDRFERDTASILAEQLAEEAIKQLEAPVQDTEEARAVAANAAAELAMHLSRAEALTHDADMHDPVRAKLHKALGYAERARGGHAAEALEHLRRALELNDRAGVKKDIERLERQVRDESAKNAGQGDAAQA